MSQSAPLINEAVTVLRSDDLLKSTIFNEGRDRNEAFREFCLSLNRSIIDEAGVDYWAKDYGEDLYGCYPVECEYARYIYGDPHVEDSDPGAKMDAVKSFIKREAVHILRNLNKEIYLIADYLGEPLPEGYSDWDEY